MSAEFAGGGFVRAASETEAAAQVGKTAPDFSLPATNGKTVDLKQYKGKIVVLEWFNHGCPFVKKHYNSNNMQTLQKEYTGKGVVWLSICSSAKGNQGYASAAEHDAEVKANKAAPTAVLMDEDGKVGRLYGAKTTPDMYVIDKKGELVYCGAIDDHSDTDVESIKSSKNYVKEALDELLAGKAVATSSTKSYGCSVKYKKEG
ncbi:MAG: thioredoxin family protein [Cyanobacteria bacterium REEB67]|nr:thioredoxin family protein [Cyanobacteria bacterium REEB67]